MFGIYRFTSVVVVIFDDVWVCGFNQCNGGQISGYKRPHRCHHFRLYLPIGHLYLCESSKVEYQSNYLGV